MLFTSFVYSLFLFLVVMLYWLAPIRFRLPLLLVASYIFYMSWSPPFGLIFGPVIFLDSLYFYGLALAMIKWPTYKRGILIFGITSELALLAYFKYANFLAHSIEAITKWLHLPAFHLEFHVFLPLAISFTSFILISYLVDVYRGKEKPHYPFLHFASYVAFFPHLIAGPIVRANELLHQFNQKLQLPFESRIFAQGLHKFIMGFAIKVFIADMIAPSVNLIYSDPSLQGFNTSWLATYGFAVQIFCDFAGYTLMAQGSALMLGFTLPENFNAPYFAKNISEFWNRWHMSLSRWLRDYLYIPLGGSRGSKLKTYRNLFITMGLGGLWHGASWTFVIWGLYQGCLLSIHKFSEYFKINRFIPKFLAIALTFHAVCIGWVFFRAEGLAQATHLLYTMFNPFTFTNNPTVKELPTTLILMFFIGHWLIRTYTNRISEGLLRDIGIGFSYFIIFYLGIVLRAPTQDFIYFQF